MRGAPLGAAIGFVCDALNTTAKHSKQWSMATPMPASSAYRPNRNQKQKGKKEMRINGTTELWWVMNPTWNSTIEAICICASPREIREKLAPYLAGCAEGITLYTSKEEAEQDALIRLKAHKEFEKRISEAEVIFKAAVKKGHQTSEETVKEIFGD